MRARKTYRYKRNLLPEMIAQLGKKRAIYST
jgi:hypothetical protein